jgi:hypothetical protein
MVSTHVQRQPSLIASAQLVCHARHDASFIVRLVVDGTKPALVAAGSPRAFAPCTQAPRRPAPLWAGRSRTKGDITAASGVVERAAPSPVPEAGCA